MLPEIYVLRHGETEWNCQGRMQGSLDSPLTVKGRVQADQMGALLARRGVTGATHQVLSSPQGRAMATALIAAQHLGAGVSSSPDLREIEVGAWTGLTRAEITAGWPAPEDDHFLDFYARAPGGESFKALWQRVTTVLDELTMPTVIITHGITSRFLRTAATGRRLDQVAELPGGQGVVFHLFNGRHEIYAP
ncbi:histidine phosphatase family protein [Actibacterium sp. 188UL27-1]|uniref:histidine phosphatase family protein n=1 Tax=Actibacterium sp. 188UL27-1 TaxID=2786961 RepID=UPI001959D395|nr:histidine phosphatase family protein [Actibacterium sp. 188UL27-1]MBM7069618.1 histidine phosphatase family protein [Actibacterium sp. 188UL27-1]